jgi:hypothetical protein
MRIIATALMLTAMWADVLAAGDGTSRVVFVRNNEIWTASEHGSSLRQLTSDGKPKQMPKWSPDGTEIAYLTSGDMSANPKSRAKIEIITTAGESVGTAPVLVTLADGTEVAGMRSVDSIGWLDPQHVFADGSVNPYVGEFRTIDVATGKMGGLGEGGYATCPLKGRVAFWAPTFPPDKRLRLEVNREDTDRFIFPDWDKLPDIHVHLLWTPGCQDVALVDPRPPAALVLVGASHGLRRVPLPGWGFENADLTLVGGKLLMRGATKALLYNFRTHAVTEAPKAMLKQIDAECTAREQLVRKLKGESPDWWTPPPSPKR